MTKCNIKREAMKRVIQGLQLPMAKMAEHLRENMEFQHFQIRPRQGKDHSSLTFEEGNHPL